MARKYKFQDNSKLYFVTFTVVDWVDVFIRKEYRDIIYDSLRYCQKHKGLEIYGYCIMTSHLHLIIGTENGILPDIVRDLKAYTSRHIRTCMEQHTGESRKDWMIRLMKSSGNANERNKDWQFWQQHNHPVELSNLEMALQRLNYIHNNPVVAGFVDRAEDWTHSSAGDYFGIRKGQLELIFLS